MNSTALSVIGSFPFTIAFAVARQLEHAGITADVKRAGLRVSTPDTYVVRVAAQHADHARTLV